MASRSKRFSRISSLLVSLAGLAVLLGWLLDIPALTSLYLPGPTLKTNAALCLMALGLANLCLLHDGRVRRWRAVAHVLAALPTAIGAMTLSQHVVGWDLGIDQLLATEPAGALATASPNRMGPPASIANVLLGTALFLVDRASPRARALGHASAFLTCAIAILPLMGYAYGFSELYSLARYTGIAMVTAVALLILGVAIQAGRPDAGLAALVCRNDEVGHLTRRLLTAGIVLPFALGWLFAALLSAGITDAPYAISAMALVLIVLMAALIWQTVTELAQVSDARAATERALSESERSLREADQQKTEFLATLSHELRNPLAPIRFALELLNGPPPVASRARQTIERQVRHLTRLIDDLLDLTRITRNKLQLHRRPSDLRELVNDAVDAVAGELEGANHRLEIHWTPQPVWLEVDPDRVVQMLVNLLTNAIRYSDPGGTISIAASLDDTDVQVSVTDTGHGIEAADLPRVFERFVQVGAGRHGGLGIGLALVKALAELHGGTVEARSAGLGRGAEFRIRLPRAMAPGQDRSGEVLRPSPTPRRILVVDDNRDAADMLAGVLTSAGHQVVVAYDGPEALRRAADFQPEVGLLDVGMDGMNGYELATRLRSELNQPGLLLVAITGWGQDDDRRRALASGFDAHLTKPADSEALSALLSKGMPESQQR
ncbi:MAG TPA: ATP-binding protein [Vicinamibacterales bacterium]|nr:ATP-binding protein [Vicinamibacterales bacterium]